ncbi:MAG: phage tail protein [Synergistaceae bacterium]|nr:phage tail protein [Synergistaceae bacterium]
MIGQLGDYEFEVSSESVRNFDGLKFSNSASYTEHKVLARKGVLEYTGLNASTASLKISLNAYLGVDPLEEIAAFYEYMNEGTALLFMLGDEVMGFDMWVIESLDEEYQEIDNEGRVRRADISLKLREYVEEEEAQE